MEETRKQGRPKTFESPEELDSLFNEYLDFCTEKDNMPNIAGFCSYLKRKGGKFAKFHRDTFYATAKYDGYSDTVKGIDMSLEDAVINSKAQPPLIKLAYLNNKHGYTQKTENVNVNVEAEMTEQEADKVLKTAGYNVEQKEENKVLS